MNRDTIQTAFVGGELSPLVMGRVDTERFLMGGERVENFVPRHQGPLVRRRGTELVSNNDCPAARLFNFEYSRTDSEMLQFGCSEIVVGGVDFDGGTPNIVATFSQYDGPFVFPAFHFTDLNYYWRGMSVTGENRAKNAELPNNPSEYPWAVTAGGGTSPGVLNVGLARNVFSGSYQMLVNDPTPRDEFDVVIPGGLPLQSSCTRVGWTGYHQWFPTGAGKTSVVAGTDWTSLGTAISAAGSYQMYEQQLVATKAVVVSNVTSFSYQWRGQTRTNPHGCFVNGNLYYIWEPGYEASYTWYRQTYCWDVNAGVDRTGVSARTQHMIAHNTSTRTITGNKSKVDFTITSHSTGTSKLNGEFKFLVTPTVGSPYYYYMSCDFVETPPTTVCTVDYPWIYDADVYLESYSFTRNLNVADDNTSVPSTTFEFQGKTNSTPLWGEPALLLAPAPNTDVTDDFQDTDTTFPNFTIMTSGYGWASASSMTSMDPDDACDDFEGAATGTIYNTSGGWGWLGVGTLTTYEDASLHDEHETYATGAITATPDGSNIIATWATDGTFI